MQNKLLSDFFPVERIEKHVNSALHVGTYEYGFHVAVFSQPHLDISMITPVSGHKLTSGIFLERVPWLGVENVKKASRPETTGSCCRRARV